MWFYLSLLSALFSGLGNIARRTHGALADPAELSWLSLLIAMPFVTGLLLTSSTPYFTSHQFVLPLVLTGIINTAASVLQFKAYKLADASVVSPIVNFLPLLLVGTSFLILGIVPSWLGIAGIVFVVTGVYYSSVSGKHSLRHPLKQIFKSAGARAMFGTVMLWSISGNLQKLALNSATPTFLVFCQCLIMLVCLSVYMLIRPQRKGIKKRLDKVMRRWGWHIAAISVFATLSAYFQSHALDQVANPSYVVAVRSLDVLITVAFAGYFLREKHTLKRFKGALIAVLGVGIIYLAR